MSCSGCTKTDGCEAEKGPQRTAIDEAISRVYPTRTWGLPDDEARFGAGISAREARRLGHALSAATRAPTFYRAGGPEDLCDYIYVLCVGREPALIDVRDGRAEPEGDRIRERYLRVHLSTVARMATVQEVAMELDRDGDAWILRELPQPGVYDAKLLKRLRSVVDLIEASDIEHLDFGMVDKPYEGVEAGDYVERFGVPPTIVNFLFYPQPARTAVTSVLAVGQASVAADPGDQRSVGP
jgi:hypothetical protein